MKAMKQASFLAEPYLSQPYAFEPEKAHVRDRPQEAKETIIHIIPRFHNNEDRYKYSPEYRHSTLLFIQHPKRGYIYTILFVLICMAISTLCILGFIKVLTG
ncbi:hypothetical protein G9A89_015813 [Geosiphon pyriformis]|nr:hypothetical protein G9A89_015813 [Geosiphon pyriformis]